MRRRRSVLIYPTKLNARVKLVQGRLGIPIVKAVPFGSLFKPVVIYERRNGRERKRERKRGEKKKKTVGRRANPGRRRSPAVRK